MLLQYILSGNRNVYTKFQSNPFTSVVETLLLKTTNVDLMVALQEKSRYHQSGSDTFSKDHKCFY